MAVDVAFTAQNGSGAAEVHMVCLEKMGRDAGSKWEIEQALRRRREDPYVLGTEAASGLADGSVKGIEFKRCTEVFDEQGGSALL